MNQLKKILLILFITLNFFGCSKNDNTKDIKNSEQNVAPTIATFEESSQEKIKNNTLAQECAYELGLNIEDFIYVSKKPEECSNPFCSIDKQNWTKEYGEKSHLVTIFSTTKVNRFGESYKVQSYCGFDHPDYKLTNSFDGRKTNEEREKEFKKILEELTKEK